jgi:hypothetical protein
MWPLGERSGGILTDVLKGIAHMSRTIEGGFHLVGTAMNVAIPLPFILSDTLRLERPNEQQMNLLQNVLANADIYGDAKQHFETTTARETRLDGSTLVSRIPLAEGESRYLLLTFTDWNSDAGVFLDAARLVEPIMWALLHVYTSEPFGHGEWRGQSFDNLAYAKQVTEWIKGDPHPILDEDAVNRITGSYAALRRIDRDAHPGIARAVELFSLFARIPMFQIFDVLGMFMLIEMLLTHNPNDKEIGDSLSHQVRYKIPFVFERMGEQLDYSTFGKDAPASKIWTKLYAYRSDIAHGNRPDFGAELKALRSAEIANAFLIATTRRLIRFSLDDPKLFDGLKPL